jgi:hypothetical protein
MRKSAETWQNIKSQALSLKVSGVGCQGRKTKTLKPETLVCSSAMKS